MQLSIFSKVNADKTKSNKNHIIIAGVVLSLLKLDLMLSKVIQFRYLLNNFLLLI